MPLGSSVRCPRNQPGSKNAKESRLRILEDGAALAIAAFHLPQHGFALRQPNIAQPTFEYGKRSAWEVSDRCRRLPSSSLEIALSGLNSRVPFSKSSAPDAHGLEL